MYNKYFTYLTKTMPWSQIDVGLWKLHDAANVCWSWSRSLPMASVGVAAVTTGYPRSLEIQQHVYLNINKIEKRLVLIILVIVFTHQIKI
jgi:hypothetical protein